MGLVIPKLVDLRDEWAVQILVLFSFSLQVFLRLFAWIRRDCSSTVARALLWLAYLLADSTAVFTLGHLSISSKLPERHQLLAFWAPFLLVHLGGQDTITAYSFEDNRLWLRHLQTLVVQVLGAAYVLYKYMPMGDISELMAAAVLIFVVGILKYGERIWALRSATFDNIWSSIDATTTVSPEDIITTSSSNATADPWGLLTLVKKTFRRVVQAEEEQVDTEAVQVDTAAAERGAEALLMGAHGLFNVCKGLFIGMRGRRLENMHEVLRSFQKRGRLGKLMEMELSLMYDILYTKAAVIHTWYGCCIRIVSLVATAAALLLFHLSLISSSKQYDRRKADVTITYVLLWGALILEVVSVVSAGGSTWTRVLLHDSKWRQIDKWRWLDNQIIQLRSLVCALRHRRWSGSLGQYDLLEACAHDASLDRKPTYKEKAASYWCGHKHSRSTKLSDSTKELVLTAILKMGNRGEEIGSLPGMLMLQRLQLDDHIGWSVQDMEIEDSVMAWHLASRICLFGAANREDDNYVQQADLVEAVRVLSNYMMFLLVVQPYMLPGPVRRSRYIQARGDLQTMIKEAAPTTSSPQGKLHWALVKGLHAHTNSSGSGTAKLHDMAVRIANVLHHRPDGMKIIFRVWVEMLCYVANNCSTESHARQLSNGGEFVTIVWLMARHANLSYASS